MHKLFPVKKQGGLKGKKKDGNAFERVGRRRGGGREGGREGCFLRGLTERSTKG